MKIAIICPVGPLDRMGYQHIWYECITTMALFAERVYLVSSVRKPLDTALLARLANVRLISDGRTWFEQDEAGNEIFDADKPMKNCNLGLQLARDDWMDCALVVFCNWYIPAPARKYLRRRCTRMVESGLNWDWLYRGDQLADRLFHASTRLPFIVNTHIPNLVQYDIDSIVCGTWRTPWERGDFCAHDADAVVDVQLEVPLADLAAQKNFTRCYADLMPKRKSVFEWDYWRRYYVDKFGKKALSDAPLDIWGRAIAAKSQPDFVSREILGAL